MNESFVAALDRAIAGDAQALQEFGVEQQIVTSPLWDDRVTVDGTGAITLTSRRPSGDDGVPIGLFRGKLGKQDLLALMKALRALSAAPPPPSRSEAYETRVNLSAVAGGYTFAMGVPARPDALLPIEPVKRLLSEAMAKAMKSPVRSLAMKIELPGGAPRSGAVEVLLRLNNAGSEGFWFSNPATVENKPEHERVELRYNAPLVITPGIAPEPITRVKTPLAPARPAAGQPRFVWVPPKGEVTARLQANIDAGDAKELVFSVALHGDEGDSQVAGQPRLKGSVFSPGVTVPVK